MPLLALWPTLQEAGWRPWRRAGEVARVAWPYALPVAMFLAYWAWNGTISLSKTVAGGHPDLELHAGNVWFSRSEEHTSELQSLMRISYAVFCLKKKNKKKRA